MKSKLSKLIHASRVIRARWAGVRCASHVLIGRGVELRRGVRNKLPGSISIGEDCELANGTQLCAWGGEIVLARRVFCGPQTVIYGHGGVFIGEASLIAMHCRIISSEHTIPATNQLIRDMPDVPKPTHIGRDVWLGAGVTVLAGVRIGDHCVVGAGAVVTRDLPLGSIAMGLPARVIGQRPTRD